MGEFTKRVQSANIAGPRKRSFSPKSWATAYEASGTPDDIDRDLYAAGLVVNEKLNNIRARLKLATSTSLSATSKLRALVAVSNHNFLLANAKAEDVIAEAGEVRAERSPEGFRLEELSNVKLE